MSKSPKEMYAVPEWMRQYLPLFQNTGGNDVEELLHDEDTNMFANSIRYMLIVSARSQFSLLMGMHSQGIALASLEADGDSEPVAFINGAWTLVYYRPPKELGLKVGDKLYAAPPAPEKAEPVAWLWSHRKHPSEVTLFRPEDDERAEGAHWSGWSCQALYTEPPAPQQTKE